MLRLEAAGPADVVREPANEPAGRPCRRRPFRLGHLVGDLVGYVADLRVVRVRHNLASGGRFSRRPVIIADGRQSAT